MSDNEYEVLSSSRFYLELRMDGSDDRIDGYFMECSGFQRKQDIIEFSHVTPQKWGKNTTALGRVVRTKIPGNSSCNNLVLKRGMTISTAVWDWFRAVERGNWATQRRDGDLVIYDQGAIEQARFRFLGAWPVQYKISDVKAGYAEFEIEEIELAVDEFHRVSDEPSSKTGSSSTTKPAAKGSTDSKKSSSTNSNSKSQKSTKK
ncbi:MAG: phage tail protein [Leptolyngbyaceae cyanobacterium CSU_1_4]|nr:phage tail protein [Leptolyngbyaceae cyanobacterium CSU_1_4]